MTIFGKHLTLSAILLLSTSALAAKDTDILAKINTRTITVGEFNKRFEQNSQLIPGKAPPKSEVLKNIVYFELATQEARKMNLHKDDSLREQFDILLYQAFIRKTIQPKVDALKPAEADVQAYYEANPLIRTRHIVFLTRPGMSKQELRDLREKAEKIQSEAKDKKGSFEELARKYSEGPDARTGGDVEWGARHKLLPEYYEVAVKLPIGDVSNVVETPYGFHIIQMVEKKPYRQMDASYKEFIIKAIKENKGQQLFAEYFEGLKKKSAVVVNEQLL